MKHLVAPNAWLDLDFTERLRKHTRVELEQAHTNLLAACRASQDGGVRQRFGEWDQIASFLKQLERVNAHGADDGSTDGDD